MIFTFYSFKGGVGRSMAMANVAWELASRGLRVLAVDFDLEAPGLERYFDLPVAAVHGSAGVIDLIGSFKRALSGVGSMGPEAEFRRLDNFIHRPVADFGRGRLDLMPAGRRASDEDKRGYALAVRTFDWQDFYFNWEGQSFFEWLRRSLVEGPDAPYDVVLADSRTGVTEMGGVCACQLADVVVMLSAPNHQNVEGTRELAADLNSEAVQRLRGGRPPLGIVVVPARVEQRVPGLLADFERRFHEAFSDYLPPQHAALGLKTLDIALPYVPEYAFEEQVAHQHAGGNGSDGLDQRYRRLTDALLVLCGPASSPALQEAAQAARQRLAGQASPSAPHGPLAFDPTLTSAGVEAYLSCPRGARDQAAELMDALDRSGTRLRREFGESEAFGAERDLPPTVIDQLRHALSLVLFADPQGVRPWQRAELVVARSLPRPPALVQVLLPGAPEDAFRLAFGDTLRDCPLIDLRGWPQERAGLWLLAEALRPGAGRAPDTSVGPQPPPAASAASVGDGPGPFPGVAPYGEGDASAFQGRDTELQALRAMVLQQRRALLDGPSGAGKTSLVRAGLLPSLRGESLLGELVCVDVRTELADAPAADRAARLARWQALADNALVVLDHADEGPGDLGRELLDWWKLDTGPRLLLVWRDAPLRADEEDADANWQAVARQAAGDPKHGRHHTLQRGGYAGLCNTVRSGADGAAHLSLAPLEAGALRTALEFALARAGRRAEAGLMERLFNDAGAQPMAATLQRAMQALWKEQLRGWLTNDAYDSLGGVEGLFNQELQRHWNESPDAEQPAFTALLLRLMRQDQDGTLQCRPLHWARSGSMPVVAGRIARLVFRLARAGLLRVAGLGTDVTVELAHRPRAWAPLQAVQDKAPPGQDYVSLVADAYAQWIETGDASGADASLDASLTSRHAGSLSQTERAFAERRQADLLRRRQGRNLLVGLGLAVLIAGGVLSFMQTREQARAERDAASLAAQAARGDLQARIEAEAAAARAASAAATTPQQRVTVVAHRTGTGAADAEWARQLLASLPAARFQVAPQIEAVQQQVCGDVRLHHPADAEAARQALDLLNAALKRRNDVRRLDLNDRSGVAAAATVQAGTLEVWLPPHTDAPAQRNDRWGKSQLVSAGCAVLGSEPKDRDTLRRGLNAPAVAWYDRELPLRRKFVDAFYIGRTEVTAAAFAEYQNQCQQASPACPPWKPRYLDPATEPRRPATFVSWTQAQAYCRWAGGRLPTDVEWEKAARGPDGHFWPWGDEPDESRFQGKAQSPARPVDVGSFPAGNSPYGVADMAGNVWEYTSDSWDATSHSMRGGSYLNTLMESRGSARWASGQEAQGTEHLGFRCVADLKR